MEWIYIGFTFVALAVLLWYCYSLWTSVRELAKDEPVELAKDEQQAKDDSEEQASVLEIPLGDRHGLFPWRKADDHTTLSWTHRLGPEDRCEIRFPGMGGVSIVGAVSSGYYTLILLSDGGIARVTGPLPVEVVRSATAARHAS